MVFRPFRPNKHFAPCGRGKRHICALCRLLLTALQRRLHLVTKGILAGERNRLHNSLIFLLIFSALVGQHCREFNRRSRFLRKTAVQNDTIGINQPIIAALPGDLEWKSREGGWHFEVLTDCFERQIFARKCFVQNPEGLCCHPVRLFLCVRSCGNQHSKLFPAARFGLRSQHGTLLRFPRFRAHQRTIPQESG